MYNTYEYIFHDKEIVHVLQTKPSSNKKLGIGIVMQTYHFSLQQVIHNDLTLDKDNCRLCPLSYVKGDGQSQGCYCHKGLQRFGLISMLKKLHRIYHEDKIKLFHQEKFDNYKINSKTANPILLRLGAYGEAVLMPFEVVDGLVGCAKNFTAYTHLWDKPEYQKYSKYFMASTHGYFETLVANSMGFRAFESAIESDVKTPICPAAKEFKHKKKTCIQCGACDGVARGKTNNIFIKIH